MAVSLINLWSGINNDVKSQLSVVKKFDKLLFKNKLIFSISCRGIWLPVAGVSVG